MKGHGEILAEHYQKTYELTFDLWKERNRLFLALITAIGAATILTFSPANTAPLLVLWAAKALGVSGSTQVQEFGKSFPFGLVQSILLIVIFYLMVNLYRRADDIVRNYRYLGDLENEIRAQLGSAPNSIAFTREGAYYWHAHHRFQAAVKWCFIILLGLLLLVFLLGRICIDFIMGKWLLGLMDVVVSSATALFFAGYIAVSVSMDGAKTVSKSEAEPLAKAKSA